MNMICFYRTPCTFRFILTRIELFQLHEYEIHPDVHVRIFDIRGYEEERGYEHEIEHLLNGNLKTGYKVIFDLTCENMNIIKHDVTLSVNFMF